MSDLCWMGLGNAEKHLFIGIFGTAKPSASVQRREIPKYILQVRVKSKKKSGIYVVYLGCLSSV